MSNGVMTKTTIKCEKKLKKSKRNWLQTVCRGCTICMFRIMEAVCVFLAATIISVIVGALVVPNIAFSMATSAGITQGTDFYTASALWLLPMLFFVLIIALGSFCALKWLFKALHNLFSKFIEKTVCKSMNNNNIDVQTTRR